MPLSTALQSTGQGAHHVMVSTQILKNLSECIARAQNACKMAKMLSQKSVDVFGNEEAIFAACQSDVDRALLSQGATLQGPM